MAHVLDSDQLRTFVAIVDAGSFTKAADVVHKTQSAVSMQIKRLEERIGRPLFERDGRNARLTEDGERVLDYARRSADPVGRLLLHLFERTEPPMLAWSDSICSALQLINFLQDVAIDWQKGRVYLARDELAAAGLDESWIAQGRVDERWSDFMATQAARAGAMLESGAPLARALPGRVGLELRMIVSGGLRIVHRLQRVRGDVFRQRPRLGAVDWMAIAGRTLWFPAAARPESGAAPGGMR